MSVRFHINPETGRANKCSATTKPCKYATESETPPHYDSKEEAQKAYEYQNESLLVETSMSKKTKSQNTELSEAQQTYFKDSACVDSQGVLIKAYHGSSVEFNSFDENTLGRGTDAWGNGFYFTTQEATAKGYASGSESPTANVKEFYINLKNPIVIDGKEHMGFYQRITQAQATKFIAGHPNIYLQPGEEDENGNTNPLEDFDDTFWDKDSWTKDEIGAKIQKTSNNYFKESDFSTMENFYGRDNGAAFSKNAIAITGHDGVIVDFHEDGKFFIAWDNSQMKLTSNENPTQDSTF